MDDRLLSAVDNNARWCDAVCRAQRIGTAWMDDLWVSSEPSPRFYPEAVTLREKVPAQRVIDHLPDQQGCSVKDSFADLDLERHGFRVLFEARWLYLPPGTRARKQTGWIVVDTEENLADCARAMDVGNGLTSKLLQLPDVRVGRRGGPLRVEAWAVLNRTGPVVGVSNVIGAELPAQQVWSGATAFAQSEFPALPVVGYERGPALEAALAIGFEDLGPLRVWVQAD